MVAEFEAGAEMAVGEEGGAHAGAEGEGEFDTFAADGAIALDGGVVGDADGLLPAFFKLFLQGEADPFGVEVGGGVGDAALDDAGKADGDAVEGGQQRVELVEAPEHGQRRGDGGRRDALAVADGLAVGVEQHGLEAGAADVDGEGDGAGGLSGTRLGGLGGSGFCGFGSHQGNCRTLRQGIGKGMSSPMGHGRL